MTVWRPPQSIRVKVLGLVWRDNQLLLSEVEDDQGRVNGLRALGGCVEFGETREEALQREFHEELGIAVTILPPWHSFENLFVHEGATGHEYVFVSNVRAQNERLRGMESVRYLEVDGTPCRAGWFETSDLPDGVELYPAALLELIESGAITPV